MRSPRISLILLLATTAAMAFAVYRALPLVGLGREAATKAAHELCGATPGCRLALVRDDVKSNRRERVKRVIYELDGTLNRWQLNALRANTHGRVPRDGGALYEVDFLVDGRPLVQEPMPTPAAAALASPTKGGRK